MTVGSLVYFILSRKTRKSSYRDFSRDLFSRLCNYAPSRLTFREYKKKKKNKRSMNFSGSKW